MPRSDWTREAIRKIEADFNRSADTDTHVIPLDLPGYRTSVSISRMKSVPDLNYRMRSCINVFAFIAVSVLPIRSR
jgi:hypothetical protein